MRKEQCVLCIYSLCRHLFCVPPVHTFVHHNVKSAHAAIATTSCNSASTLVCVHVMSSKDVFILCVSLSVCTCCSLALPSMWWWWQLDHLLLCLPNALEPGAQTALNRIALLWRGKGGSKRNRGPFEYCCVITIKSSNAHRGGCQFQVVFPETNLCQLTNLTNVSEDYHPPFFNCLL